MVGEAVLGATVGSGDGLDVGEEVVGDGVGGLVGTEVGEGVGCSESNG